MKTDFVDTLVLIKEKTKTSWREGDGGEQPVKSVQTASLVYGDSKRSVDT